MSEVAEIHVPELDAAEKTTAQLFRYSTWLHVGDGADQCSDVAEDSQNCSDPLHFHAWCRLPNQFQHREIREKALAARARRVRQLRDVTSDSAAIMEDDIDAIMRGPDVVGTLVDELVSKDWWKDYIEAVRELHDFEDDKDERPWQMIDRDRDRYAELQANYEADRPNEEYAELETHLLAYTDAINVAHEAILKPKRDALTSREPGDLADLVREQRIDADAQSEFMHTYSMWQWYAGTLTHPNGERRFKSIDHMQAAAPEVITALSDTFDDLEQTFDGGPTKNS